MILSCRVLNVICWTACPESTLRCFCRVFLFQSTLYFLPKNNLWLEFRKFYISFTFSLSNFSVNQPASKCRPWTYFSACSTKNCIQNQTWGFFADIVCSKVLFVFFLKLDFELNRIISASSLMCLAVTWRSLVNWSLVYFGICSTNQCTHNQIKVNAVLFLCWRVLFGFSLKVAVELGRVTSK